MFPRVALIPIIWADSGKEQSGIIHSKGSTWQLWLKSNDDTYCSCRELWPGSFQSQPLCCHHPTCEAAYGTQKLTLSLPPLPSCQKHFIFQTHVWLYLIHHHQSKVFHPAGLYQGVDEAVGFLYRSDIKWSLVSSLYRRKPALTASVFLHHEVQLQAKAC